MKLYAPSTIADIKERYNFQLSKSLGQNFITDRSIIERIIEGSGAGENDLVIEIGPGIGVLTAEAAEAAAKVIAVEIDRKLIPILSETLAEYDNVSIINQDILKTDVNKIIEEEKAAGSFTGAVRIIGNLPYYITTPIIMGLLESGVKADSITVMMQKEVADRIKASPGGKFMVQFLQLFSIIVLLNRLRWCQRRFSCRDPKWTLQCSISMSGRRNLLSSLMRRCFSHVSDQALDRGEKRCSIHLPEWQGCPRKKSKTCCPLQISIR